MSEWINCRNCGTLIENLCACPNCDPVPSAADQAKGPSAAECDLINVCNHMLGTEKKAMAIRRHTQQSAQPLIDALRSAESMLSAVGGDLEDGHSLDSLRPKYVNALIEVRDDVRDAIQKWVTP